MFTQNLLCLLHHVLMVTIRLGDYREVYLRPKIAPVQRENPKVEIAGSCKVPNTKGLRNERKELNKLK